MVIGKEYSTEVQTVEDDIDLQLSSEKKPESVPFSHYTALKLPHLKNSHEDINPQLFFFTYT